MTPEMNHRGSGLMDYVRSRGRGRGSLGFLLGLLLFLLPLLLLLPPPLHLLQPLLLLLFCRLPLVLLHLREPDPIFLEPLRPARGVMFIVEFKHAPEFERLGSVVAFDAAGGAPGFDFVLGDAEDVHEGFELGFAEGGIVNRAESGHGDDVLVVGDAADHGYGAVGDGTDGSDQGFGGVDTSRSVVIVLRIRISPMMSGVTVVIIVVFIMVASTATINST